MNKLLKFSLPPLLILGLMLTSACAPAGAPPPMPPEIPAPTPAPPEELLEDKGYPSTAVPGEP
ncbi:MAG: hypothetical protein OEW82_09025, partial [Dehalococcoidia bacterium]|nr:hypothetical protein [Dehalococcoidia bacterium]